MIIDEDLEAWLADRGAHRRSDAAVLSFGRDWGETAPHIDFDAVMAAQKDLVEIVHTLKQVVCVKG